MINIIYGSIYQGRLMKNTKIAVAKISSVDGNVTENIAVHMNAIEKAVSVGVSYIVFPELSLTGYLPECASNLAFTVDDKRLQPLIDIAKLNKITVGVGLPLLTTGLPHIGLAIIYPTGRVESYAKMNLHSGEETYFSVGDKRHSFQLNNITVANAICADTNHIEHAKGCAALGADVYMASVLITAGGYDADTQLMSSYAREFNMLVAMANHNRPTGNWDPVGKSAIWTKSGQLICADESHNALVIAERKDNDWIGQVINL